VFVTIPAGAINRRIAFERPSVTRSPVGTEIEGPWTEMTQAWAAVAYGTASERRDAAAMGSNQAATFTVRATASTRDVTPQDRINFDGSEWSIAGRMLSADRSTMVFTATRRTG